MENVKTPKNSLKSYSEWQCICHNFIEFGTNAKHNLGAGLIMDEKMDSTPNVHQTGIITMNNRKQVPILHKFSSNGFADTDNDLTLPRCHNIINTASVTPVSQNSTTEMSDEELKCCIKCKWDSLRFDYQLQKYGRDNCFVGRKRRYSAGTGCSSKLIKLHKNAFNGHYASCSSIYSSLSNTNQFKIYDCNRKNSNAHNSYCSSLKSKEDKVQSVVEQKFKFQQVEVVEIKKRNLRSQISEKFDLAREQIQEIHHSQTLKDQLPEISMMKKKIAELESTISLLRALLKDIKSGREMENARQLQELRNKDTIRYVQELRDEIDILRNNLAIREEEFIQLTDYYKETRLRLDEEIGISQRLQTTVNEFNDKKFNEISLLENSNSQLQRCNHSLMDKLIQLIKDKEALWVKNEQLKDQQNMYGKWMDDSKTDCCMECHEKFTFFFRRHHCRICGKIFCKNCSNNWMMIKASRKKSRVCRKCFINDTFMSFKLLRKKLSKDEESLYENENCQRIIPLRSRSWSDLPSIQDNSPNLHVSRISTANPFETTSLLNDEDELPRCSTPCEKKIDESMSNSTCNFGYDVIGDEEISKSLSATSPYSPNQDPKEKMCVTSMRTVKDIEEVERSNPEFMWEAWVDAGGSYSVPVFVKDNDLSIIWEFTTMPLGISFALHFKEVDVAPEQVLIQPILPTTRCSSHTHPIHGSIKVRRRGVYTLIFDNRFSKMAAKKLKYKLKIIR